MKTFFQKDGVTQLGKVNFRVSGWPRFLRGSAFFLSETIRLSRFGSLDVG